MCAGARHNLLVKDGGLTSGPFLTRRMPAPGSSFPRFPAAGASALCLLKSPVSPALQAGRGWL